jgi:hypothetical protein
MPVVPIAEAMSPALLPGARRSEVAGENCSRKASEIGYVFSRIEPRHRLCRDAVQDAAGAKRGHDGLAPAT